MLSPREKDVLELMLRGYGTDISAERLGIAVETVRRIFSSICTVSASIVSPAQLVVDKGVAN